MFESHVYKSSCHVPPKLEARVFFNKNGVMYMCAVLVRSDHKFH